MPATITNGSKFMQAVTYTGTGATQTIAVGFQPDFVWIKSRSAATDHKLTDSVRGVTKALISDTTGAETTDVNGLTAFTSNGFTIGSDSVYNTNGATYVAWCWQAGQGTTSSNTNGSITSTVSVNATAGFSIVTYTGNGTNATVGHGLGVAPKFIIGKIRNQAGYDWTVYHASLGATQYLYLDSTQAANSSALFWNNTAPSSTVLTLGTGNSINSNGNTFVFYCFAEIAGFSKFGSYTGNGSADGPFVYTGFLPKFILTKRTDTTSDWIIYDTARDTYNAEVLRLYPNASTAETNAGAIDGLSNGFKLRDNGPSQNASGGTYIYMAFASNPFAQSNAR